MEYRVIAAALFLLPASIMDLRSKTVPIVYLIVSGTGVMALDMLFLNRGDLSAAVLLQSVLPGAFLLSAALLTGKSMGYGDGFAFLILGQLMKPAQTWALLFVAMTGTAIVSGVLLLFHKVGRKTRIPFLPFAAAGFPVLILFPMG